MPERRQTRRTTTANRASTARAGARAEQPREPAAARVAPRKPVRATLPLNASQRRYLRGFAHDLKPIILVGQKGVTPAVLGELDSALSHHELVKVKLAGADRESRAAAIEQLRAAAGADIVQTIGRVACLYRQHPGQPRFTLPE